MKKNLDTLVISVLLVVALIIGAVLFVGDRLELRVRSFNLAGAEVSSGNVQLLFEFSREVLRESAEENFSIEPQLDGKFSWSGRKMAYTLTQLPAAGQTYTVSLSDIVSDDGQKTIVHYESSFSIRQERIVYIEDSRLGIFDTKTEESKLLTPDDLLVFDFKPGPRGKRVFFFAAPESHFVDGFRPSEFQQLYDIDIETGNVTLHADNRGYVNQLFDISPDGESLLLNRVAVAPDGIFVSNDLWIKKVSEKKWKQFWYTDFQAGPFLFTPNPEYIVMLSRDGYMLVPVENNPGDVQFLGNFADVHDFSAGKAQIAFLQYGDNDIFSQTSSSVVLGSGGIIKKVFENEGFVSQLRFGDNGQSLYFLFRESAVSEPFQFYRLVHYDLESGVHENITDDLHYFDASYDVSADGDSIVIGRYQVYDGVEINTDLLNEIVSLGYAESDAELWIYRKSVGSFQRLPIRGQKPMFIH